MSFHAQPTELTNSEVHLWSILPSQELGPTNISFLLALLTPEEVTYANGCLPKRRTEFVIARAGLRLLLSKYHPEIRPRDWRFHTNQYGRPELDSMYGLDLNFNVSHSGGATMYAFARRNMVGVDVEETKRMLDFMDLATSHFSLEESTELATHEGALRARRFFEYWTLKEALIKALGVGLSLPLQDFTFSVSSGGVEVSFSPTLPEDPSSWRFLLFNPSPGYQGAVAVKADGQPDFVNCGNVDLLTEATKQAA